MRKWREAVEERPWIGWCVAGVLLVIAVVVYVTRSSSADVQYSQEYMSKTVTVKFADTGEEIELPRGRFEKMLRNSAGGTLDPSKGLINPKTNQPTGFLFNKSDWEETVKRINQEREEYGSAGPAAPQPAVAPAK